MKNYAIDFTMDFLLRKVIYLAFIKWRNFMLLTELYVAGEQKT